MKTFEELLEGLIRLKEGSMRSKDQLDVQELKKIMG